MASSINVDNLILNITSFMGHGSAVNFIETMAFDEIMRESKWGLDRRISHIYRDEYYKISLSESMSVNLNCFYTKEFEPLYDPIFKFIETQGDYMMAGGFAVQLWLGKEPAETSDIDVFILSTKGARNLLNYLDTRSDYSIETPNGKFLTSIFQIKIESLKYRIQFILLDGKTPMKVLRDFDFSHCRCMIYRGKLYATPDAKRSLDSRRCFVSKEVRVCRLVKALRYVDTVLNVEPTGLKCECQDRNKSVWKEIGVLPRFSDSQTYFSNRYHTLVKQIQVKKYFDVSRVEIPRFSYLEECSGAVTIPTFTLKYTRALVDTGFTLERRVFSTEDKRFSDVLEYWKGIKEDVYEKNKKSQFWKRGYCSRVYFREPRDYYWFNMFKVDGLDNLEEDAFFQENEEYTFCLLGKGYTFIVLKDTIR